MATAPDWTSDELASAAEAYLQMRGLEERGEKYNKAAVQRMLLAGPLARRSTAEHRMQNISHVLSTMGRSWIKGYPPLPNVGDKTANILRKIIEDLTAPDAPPLPLRPPVETKSSRELPPTGYWMFVCNRARWDAEGWLRQPSPTFLYRIAEHHRNEVQPGDLGVLRINAKRGTASQPARPAGVYAIVEIVDHPQLQADAGDTHYADRADAQDVTWRAPLKLVANLVNRPLLVDDLPAEEEFRHFRQALQSSTIPISRKAFAEVFAKAGVVRPGLTDQEKAATVAGVSALELEAKNADPKRRKRISAYIERGPIGAKVKEMRGCRCQVCEALGMSPVAFIKKNGSPFAEAHHVQPVSLLVSGSLAASNIMVLCPNHHRQAHLGDFEVIDNLLDRWRVRLDGKTLEIAKTALR